MKKGMQFVCDHTAGIMTGLAAVISGALAAFYAVNAVTCIKNAIDLFRSEE